MLSIYLYISLSSYSLVQWRSFEDQPYLKDGGRGHHRRDLSPRRLARVGPLSSSVSSIDRLLQVNIGGGGAGGVGGGGRGGGGGSGVGGGGGGGGGGVGGL